MRVFLSEEMKATTLESPVALVSAHQKFSSSSSRYPQIISFYKIPLHFSDSSSICFPLRRIGIYTTCSVDLRKTKNAATLEAPDALNATSQRMLEMLAVAEVAYLAVAVIIAYSCHRSRSPFTIRPCDRVWQ